MRQTCSYILALVMLFLVASCSSVKKATEAKVVDGMTEAQYFDTVLAQTTDWPALTAKVALFLNWDGKSETKVNGTLRIKRDEVIQLSVAPFLGIEVARAEISPDGVLVIDRMNKRYVQVSFAELQSLVKMEWDFHLLQSLFLNELFLPGKGELNVRNLSDFRLEQLPSGIWLEAKKTKPLQYRFQTQAPAGTLVKSCIDVPSTPYGLEWGYAEFKHYEGKEFPMQMNLLIEGAKHPIKADFKFSRLNLNSDWESRSEVSGKYERVRLDDLIKILLKK